MATFTPEEELVPARLLDGKVTLTSPPGSYIASGGTSEIYLGKCITPSGEEDVAIKVFRGAHTDPALNAVTTRRINRESRVWIRLKHPNVLPIYGICRDVLPSSALVSPYCELGSAVKFLSVTKNANRKSIVIGVAAGLLYLHEQGVIHGDLKTANVLIDHNGQARLCDFGCSKIMGHVGYTTGLPQVWRYGAPELLVMDETVESEIPKLTKQSDVYSFGMVMLEVYSVFFSFGSGTGQTFYAVILTGKAPFYYLMDTSVIIHLGRGKRPIRMKYDPPGLPDWIWKLLEACWGSAQARPTMAAIHRRLTEGPSPSHHNNPN